MKQRQDSLTDQLRDLIPLANANGMYDAADFLKRFIPGYCSACGERGVFDGHVGEWCPRCRTDEHMEATCA